MTFETGTDEIALENLQAAKSRLRGDRELPTYSEVSEVIYRATLGLMTGRNDCNRAVDALIARGFLQVKG